MIKQDRTTLFSPDRKYRYTLWREWADDMQAELKTFMLHVLTGQQPAYVMFIGLNPSTADETADDPTIRRCRWFARSWGYGAMCMTNLFALRATDPKSMMAEADPIGPDNRMTLLTIAARAALIVACWGVHGAHLCRDISVLAMLEPYVQLHHLGLTLDGHPKHPLYLSRLTRPQKWEHLVG